MTVASPITLSTLESITITPDSQATFTVTATGTGDLTYSWESSVDNGTTWSAISGANEATLTVNGADAVNGTQYRCTVSDNYGQSKTSDAAILTVEAPADLRCGDNLTYELDEATGTLTLTDIGEMWSYTSAEASPFHDLAINTIIIPDGVTVIGAHAFEGTNLTTVTLPESVFPVRYKAFWNIQNLDITVENIGCAIYEDAISSTATVHGYKYSAAYFCTTTEGYDMTFVNLKDEELSSSTNKLLLTIGDTSSINVGGKDTKYRSFDTNVVTVDSDGTVTAVGEGETKVVAYDKQGKTAVFYYSVVNENAQPNNTWRYQIV